MRSFVTLVALAVLSVLCAAPRTARAQSELQRLEQEAFDPEEPEAVLDGQPGDVIASSRGGLPLPDLDEPPLARRVSRNVARGYGGALAGFAVTQVFCAFGALRNNGNVDLGQLATYCGAAGAALGLGLATPTMFRGEGRRWAGLPGSIVGTGLGFGLAFAPNIPWGVGAVTLALVPVALAVLGYQLSDRRARRRARRLRYG